METIRLARMLAAAGLERLHRDDRGQGAVEYVGIVIVVVAIIAALAAFGPAIGEAIGNGLETIVNEFVGG